MSNFDYELSIFTSTVAISLAKNMFLVNLNSMTTEPYGIGTRQQMNKSN